jgi:hypothetical protein
LASQHSPTQPPQSFWQVQQVSPLLHAQSPHSSPEGQVPQPYCSTSCTHCSSHSLLQHQSSCAQTHDSMTSSSQPVPAWGIQQSDTAQAVPGKLSSDTTAMTRNAFFIRCTSAKTTTYPTVDNARIRKKSKPSLTLKVNPLAFAFAFAFAHPAAVAGRPTSRDCERIGTARGPGATRSPTSQDCERIGTARGPGLRED